jgi:hypothetical protein
MTAVAWVWIAGRPFWLSTANQTLGLRSIIPLLPARYRLDQGEKHSFLATHLEYRAFHFRASRYSSLQLFESTSLNLSVQPLDC